MTRWVAERRFLDWGSCLLVVQRLLLPWVFSLCYCKLYNATTPFSSPLLLLVTPIKLIGLASWTLVQSLICTGFSFWDVLRLPGRSPCLTIPGKCLAVHPREYLSRLMLVRIVCFVILVCVMLNMECVDVCAAPLNCIPANLRMLKSFLKYTFISKFIS